MYPSASLIFQKVSNGPFFSFGTLGKTMVSEQEEERKRSPVAIHCSDCIDDSVALGNVWSETD
jgi:hypothetical protein